MTEAQLSAGSDGQQLMVIAVAQHWLLFESLENAPTGSFAWVCEHLALDAHRLRSGLEAILSREHKRLPDEVLAAEHAHWIMLWEESERVKPEELRKMRFARGRARSARLRAEKTAAA